MSRKFRTGIPAHGRNSAAGWKEEEKKGKFFQKLLVKKVVF